MSRPGICKSLTFHILACLYLSYLYLPGLGQQQQLLLPSRLASQCWWHDTPAERQYESSHVWKKLFLVSWILRTNTIALCSFSCYCIFSFYSFIDNLSAVIVSSACIHSSIIFQLLLYLQLALTHRCSFSSIVSSASTHSWMFFQLLL